MFTVVRDKETGRVINSGIGKMSSRYIDEKTFEVEAVLKDKKANCELVRVNFRFFFNEEDEDGDNISSGWWAYDPLTKTLNKEKMDNEVPNQMELFNLFSEEDSS